MLGDKHRIEIDREISSCRGNGAPLRAGWVQRLRTAIVKQAADDLRVAIRTDDTSAVKALCNWFRSDWGQLLSFGQGEAIIRRIKKEEEEREQYDT